MLNACNRRNWFIIELCEPIKINQIELANFELFSNVPRLFRVYASERYISQQTNGKDWPQKYFFGLFEAANTRSIQVFTLKDVKQIHENSSTSQESTTTTTTSISSTNDENNNNNNNNSTNPVIMYAKYVKFEMLTHYGTEHYCPMSLLRIYGTSMAEDEEEVLTEELINQNEESPSIKVVVVEEEKQQQQQPTIQERKHEQKLLLTIPMFINNIISSLSSYNFNLKSLFYTFTSTPTNNNNNRMKDLFINHLNNYTTTNKQKKQRVNLIQIDLFKLLCFHSNNDCCQCLSLLVDNRSSSSYSLNKKSINWLNNKCAYYFLINTIVNMNKSMLINYLHKFNQIDLLNNSNKTQLLINSGFNLNISDEWLDNQHLQIVNKKQQKNLNESIKINNNQQSIESINNETESVLLNELNNNNNNTNDSELNESQIVTIDDETLLAINDQIEPTLAMPTTTPMPEVTTLPPPPQQSQSTSVDDTEPVKIIPNSTTTTTTNKSPPIIIANGKDAAFMRLTNRIKILELNMSLSSQYLEKLSQHYRFHFFFMFKN
jgi:hypothetical protein